MINHGSLTNFHDNWNTASGPDIKSHEDKGATYDLNISSRESTVCVAWINSCEFRT